MLARVFSKAFLFEEKLSSFFYAGGPDRRFMF